MTSKVAGPPVIARHAAPTLDGPAVRTAHPRRAVPAAESGRRRWPWGLIAIVVPYLCAFSLTSYTAYQILTGRGVGGQVSWRSLALVAATTGIGIVLALVLSRMLVKLSWTELGMVAPSRRRVGQGLLVCCAAYFLMWVAFQVFQALPVMGLSVPVTSSPTDHASALQVVVYSLTAGLGEEILIVAVPVAVMTALRWRWPFQIFVLILLRVPFHLYYGYTAVVLAVVWSVLFWLLYRRYRWVWPLVAAHVAYDCVVNSGVFGTGSVVFGLGAVVLLLVGASCVVREIALTPGRIGARRSAAKLALSGVHPV